MRHTIQRRNPSRMVRFIAGFTALIAIIICGGKIAEAIKYDLITVSGTNGNIIVNGNHIDGLNITPALIFNQTGDAITYKMTLTSTDQKGFQIKNITDDNINPYITTSYEYDNKISDKDKPIFITLTYSSYLPFGDKLDLNDIHITINLEEKADDQNPPEDQNRPDDKPDTRPDGESSEPSSGNNNGNDDASDDNNITIPNTGFGGGSVYFKPTSSDSGQQILPNIIICIVSAAAIITVLPTPRKHRMQFSTVAAITLVFTLSGIFTLDTKAKSTTLQLTIFGSNISATPNTENPVDVVTMSFPNIYNAPGFDSSVMSDYGNAIIIKTIDNKYVLSDAGFNRSGTKQVIYDKLKELQQSEKVVIDYLLISHLDGDHYGSAIPIMNDANIDVKNIVLKHEYYTGTDYSKEKPFKDLTSTAFRNGVNIITSGDAGTIDYMTTLTGSSNYDKISEGMSIDIGKYVKIHIFNTASVYDGKTCMVGQKLDWTAALTASNYYKTPNDEYVYFIGTDYPDVKFYTTPTLTKKTDEQGKQTTGLDRYFYATTSNQDICKSNPNAFGFLVEITTTNLNRYVYLANDLENAGYSTLSGGANSSQIFENLTLENDQFITDVTPFQIPSEINVANSIYAKLEKDAARLGVPVEDLLNNIVIYQQSHHGGNNNEEAVWKLNLNRSENIYAINENKSKQATTTNWRENKSYWYVLSNIPAERKLSVGVNTQNGIDCQINTIGSTVCASY